MTSRTKGFTLIELMVVVAVIGILAAIALPKFADLTRKSQESNVLGQLGSLRSAITIYYSDNEGLYPGTYTTAIIPKYLAKMPEGQLPAVASYANPGHTLNNGSSQGAMGALADAASSSLWYFVDSGSDEGAALVNCTHLSTKGRIWSIY